MSRVLKRTAALIALIALSLSGAACGSSQSTHSSQSTTASDHAAAPAALGHVVISGYAFHPPAVTVTPGTRLTFTNHDQTSHTATSTGKGFDTGTIPPGASRTVVLTQPGTYTYYCQFHAFMRATVIVK
ncbi:MAG: cupredoxin domain-containing protein [Solirubrobacteraceae bacterium]